MSSVSGRRPGIGPWRMVAALVRQRRRLVLATIAVALAVGYLAGALTLLNRVSEGLDNLAAAGAERADLIVEGEVAYESSLEETRRLVPASIAESLQGQPGIEAVIPRIEEVTVLLDQDNLPVVAPGLSEQPIGANWPDDEAMSPYRFVGEGRPPTEDGEVVIDERSARVAGVEVGDQIVVQAKTAVAPYEVTGIVTTAEGDLPAGSSLALFSTEQARTLFDTPENDNRVAIRLADDADPDEVAERIRAQLPPGSELVDGETGARHRQESLTRSFTLVRVLIMGFAGLALIVGMLTVANSLTLLYTDRRRTFAAFRLVGAKQYQLLAAALTEAALLAVVASLIGVPLGLVLGRVIEGALGALGTSIPVGGSIVSLPALAWAVIIGVIATVVSAIVPARRACRVPPIEAVLESPGADLTNSRHRLANSALIAVAVAALVCGLMMLADTPVATALGVSVAVGVFLLAVVLLPTALSYAVAAGILLVPTRPATLRRIGSRDAVRNRSRTAATTGALMLATAVVAGLAVFLSSFTASINADVDGLVRSDLVVDSRTFTKGGLPADLLEQIGELPDVEAVSGWQIGRVTIANTPVRVTGIDGVAINDVLSPGWVGEEPAELSARGIALDSETANALGLSLGDQVPVLFTSDGVENLTLEGIYSRGSVLLGEAMIDRSVLIAQVPASFDIAGLVKLTEDTPAARAEVEELAASYGVNSVLEPSGFVDSRSDLLRGFERVIQWMLLFTLVQALVGVVNTLLLSVGERRREFGLLRTSGASREQIHRLVLVEGMSFAVIGTVLGLLAGIGIGVGAIRALGRFGIEGVDIPVPVLVVTAVAAIALGVLAAVVPARWAAAIPPLEAVSDAGGERPRDGRGGLLRRLTGLVGSATPGSRAAAPGSPPASPVPAAAAVPSSPPPFTGVAPPVPRIVAPMAALPPAPPAQSAPPVPDLQVPPPSETIGEPIAMPPVANPFEVPVTPEPVIVEPVIEVEPVEPVVEVEPVEPAVEEPAFDPAAIAAAALSAATAAAPQARHDPEPAAHAEPAPARGSEERPSGRPPATEGDGWTRPSAAPPRRRRRRGVVFEPDARPFGSAGPGASGGPQRRERRTDADGTLDPVVSIRLGDVLERLDPQSVVDALPALVPFARALEADEIVEHLVQGWTRSMLCLVARTDRRIIVVVDRFPDALVESLHPSRTAISLYGPPGTDRVSLAVVDGRRLLEITGIRDGAEAAALRVVPTARVERPEFF